MKLFQRVAFNALNAVSKRLGIQNKFYDAFFRYLGGQYTQYDINATTYLEKGFLTNPDVYSVINQKSTKHISIPYVVKKIEDNSAKRKYDNIRLLSKNNNTALNLIRTKALSKKAFQEEELDFPMERPNPLQTWAEIIALYATFMASTGNFYLWMMRPEDGPNAGKPIQVYVLPSHLMRIVLRPDADMLDTESPIKSYMLVEGQVYSDFLAEDVIHVKYANPMYDQIGSHLYGISPLRAALRNIQSSNVAIDNNLKSMANGGAFGFIHGKGPTPLSPEQASTIRSRLKEMDADESRMGKYAGVSGELGFTRISLTTDELKPFDFLKFDRDVICNVLRWEPILMGKDSRSSNLGGRSEFELAEKRVLTKSIIPDNTLLEQALTDRFLPLFKGYEDTVFMFDYDSLPEMQPDMKTLTEWLNNALDRGVITRNEYRETIRFISSDDPGMDIFTVNSDIFSLEDAIDTNLILDEPQDV